MQKKKVLLKKFRKNTTFSFQEHGAVQFNKNLVRMAPDAWD